MADEVLIRAVRQAAPGSTGTQDYTVSGFGTPVAAIFLAGSGVTEDTEAAHETSSIGITDGSTDLCCYTTGQTAVTTTRCKHGSTDSVVMIGLAGASSIDGEAVFSSWITDGVRINWTSAPISAQLVTCILIGGDAQADVRSFSTSGSVSGTSAVNPGFKPSDVLFISSGTSFGASPTFVAHSSFFFGIAHRNPEDDSTEQGSYSKSGRDAVTTSSYSLIRSEDYALRYLEPATPSADPAYEVTSWNSTGFVVTTRLSGLSIPVAALSLDFGGRASWFGQPLSPTSTGNDSVAGVGFRPKAVLGLVTRTSSASNALTTNANAGRFGFSVFNDTEEFSYGVTAAHGVSTTNIDSVSATHSVLIEEQTSSGHTAGHDLAADFVSMDDDGYTLDWIVVDTFARYMLFLAVEDLPLTEAVDETVEIDDETVGINRGRAASETVELEEEVGRSFVYNRAVDESVEIDEDVQAARVMARAVDEMVRILEAAVTARVLLRAVDEDIEIDEAAQAQLGFVAAVDESIEIAEDVASFLERAIRSAVRRDSTIAGALAEDSSGAGAVAADDGAANG